MIAVAFFLDKFVLRTIHFIENPFLDYISYLFINMIPVLIIFFITLIIRLANKKKLEWVFPFFLSIGITYIITYILKFIFARPRPNSTELFLFNLPDYSFPSAHAAVAFAMLPMLNKEHPKQKIIWIIFVSLIAFSRIYIGVHYLSDVVAGALIGYFTSSFIIKLKQRKWKLTSSK